MDRQPHCFCDLAPLSALGVLSDSEQRWIAEQLVENPELALELQDLQAAATALAYSAPATDLNPALKERLFNRIGEPLPESLPLVPTPTQQDEPFLAIPSADLRWRPHSVPGTEVAILHLDRVSRMVSGVLKAAPGVHYPLHRHAAVEELFMLEGDLRVGTTVYGPGDYLRSASGSCHDPVTKGGCRFFFRTSFDDEFLEAATST
ncbi:MAG: cupin domain-containing protein [Thermosynechococcaceae cyanobacterium]